MANHMHYLEKRLARNVLYFDTHQGRLDVYDDTACDKDLMDAWRSGAFSSLDVALQFSIDGAQLRPDKPSEAWVFIWVIHNLPPTIRYTKAFVIPATIVLGPNKPVEIDSFLFPSLYHVAALQREGLIVFDASLGRAVPSCRPVIIFGTADSLGSAAMTGMVGHSGRYGCQLYCNMLSRRRMGDSHYYPTMNCPIDYAVANCVHPDVTDDDLAECRDQLPVKYAQNINFLLGARTQADYRQRQLDLGLCKQTLFSGLPLQLLPVPSNFTMDIMHLSVLNHPDLFIKLFTSKLDVYEPDDRQDWDWAVFYRNNALWEAHGETVDLCSSYIPSAFGCTPCNPAKKINTGYKAWEYQLYFYGLCPALYRHILPCKYWVNYCRLVAGIRLLQQHTMSRTDVI